MDPKAFDALFQAKVGEADGLYQEEIQTSKPYAWTAVQSNLAPVQKDRKWFYLAAACLLLFFGLGSVWMLQTNKQHQSEMAVLKAQLNQLSSQNTAQEQQVGNKNDELLQLQEALEALQASVLAKESEAIQQAVPQYIVRKDTVVIERIQYIEQPVAPLENITEVQLPVQKEEVLTEKPPFDREVAIFPSDKPIVRSKNEVSGRGFRLAQLSKQ